MVAQTPNTFENSKHRISNALSVKNIGIAAELLGQLLTVPQNTRVFLTAIEGSVVDAEGPSAVSNALIFGLFKGGSTLGGWTTLETLMSRHLSRQVVGSPTNALVMMPPAVIDTNLVGRASTQQVSKGANSNGVSGWGIAAVASVASYSIYFDIVIHFIAEWINGSGSKKRANPQFDEEENQ